MCHVGPEIVCLLLIQHYIIFTYSLTTCSYHVSSILKTGTRNLVVDIRKVINNSSPYWLFPVFNTSEDHWALVLYTKYFPTKIFVLQSKANDVTTSFVDTFVSKLKTELILHHKLDVIEGPEIQNCNPGLYVIAVLHRITLFINNPLGKDMLKAKLDQDIKWLHESRAFAEDCNISKQSLSKFCNVMFEKIVHHPNISYVGIRNQGTSCYIIALFQMMFTLIDWFIEIATNINTKIEKPGDIVWHHICNMMFSTMKVDAVGTIGPVQAQQVSLFKRYMRQYCPLNQSEYLKDDNTQFGVDDVLLSLYDINSVLFKRFVYSKEEFVECDNCKIHQKIITDDYMMRIYVKDQPCIQKMENILKEIPLETPCHQCRKMLQCTEVEYTQLPETLLVWINRIEDYLTKDKLICEIDVYSNNGQVKFGDITYRLTSVIYHLGDNSDEGHYVTDSLRNTRFNNKDRLDTKLWHHFDDDSCENLYTDDLSKLHDKDLLWRRKNCVMLMLEKVYS